MASVVVPSLASATLGIKRWNGDGGPAIAWDGLRKDADLWTHNGDCNVYLFAKGRSRRGPSFQIPSQLLHDARCEYLLSRITLGGEGDSGYSSGSSMGNRLEIHIPVPDHLDRQESLQWHIATRNFFAWLIGKPIVGDRLGPSIVRLLERMNAFREQTVDNVGDLLTYLTRIGYARVTDRPDHALAMLLFAETTRLKDVWLNAFVHCVGMNDVIVNSAEYEAIGDVSKALITRAHLYMDIHLDSVTKSLETFLEDDLSSTHLGLSPGARANLDNFRSFLSTYSVVRYGYWPPQHDWGFPKDAFQSMQMEFQSLYNYLVDRSTSEGSQHLTQSASGGVCVQQNIDVFNERHQFRPLASSMPLVPKFEPGHRRSTSHKTLKSMMLGGREYERRRTEQARVALMNASNHTDIEILASPLVQAYVGYENDCAAAQGDDVAEARKVRWILIYGVLQMLASVMRAPPGIKESRSAPYPICCSIADLPPWKDVKDENRTNDLAANDDDNTQPSRQAETQRYTFPSRASIRPDCEMNDDFHILFKHQVHPAMREKPALQRIMTASRPMNALRKPSLRSKLNPSRKSIMLEPLPVLPFDDAGASPATIPPKSSTCSPVAEAGEEHVADFSTPPLCARRDTLDRLSSISSEANRNSLTSSEYSSTSPPSLVCSSESNDHSDSENSSPMTPICSTASPMDMVQEGKKGLPMTIARLRYDFEDHPHRDSYLKPSPLADSTPLDRLADGLEATSL